MENTTSQSLIDQGKDNSFKAKSQRSRIFIELFKSPMNTKMLHEITGVPRENITRRKRELEDMGLLHVLKLDYCPFSGRLTQFLTTNLQTYQNWQKQFENVQDD